MTRLVEFGRRVARLFHKEIWQTAHLKDRTPRGWLYATLRVISITGTVFNETKAVSRAASLSFSSLLGLGPLIAIAVLVAGFMLDSRDPNLVVNTINRLILYVAPQLSHLGHVEDERPTVPQFRAPPTPGEKPAPEPTPPPSVDTTPVEVNPELVEFINGIISGSRNGAAGIIGLLTLIVIVLQLFTSVENAFNEIWGVRRGRTWLTRLVFYWTILTLGAVLFFAALTGLSAGAFFNAFAEKMPFGRELVSVLQFFLPSISMLTLVIVLTLFYRYIPNTHVAWRPAVIGAIIVTLLLMLNNFLGFLYIRRVILEESLYGSLGILPVLMFGLYIFWLYVLVGGQISYAVQNVQFRNSQAAWSRLSENKRERLSLVLLLTICRRFQACLPAVSAAQLSTVMKVPTQIINESLNRLVDMKLVIPIPTLPGSDAAADLLYQPARPLNKMSLLEFKTLDDNLGDDPVGNLQHLDPILRDYDEALQQIGQQELFKKSIEEILIDYPFDESRPPFSAVG